MCVCHTFFIHSCFSRHLGCFRVLAPVINAAVNMGVQVPFFFFFKEHLFIYLFLAVLGLCCCTRAFSSCGEWGLLFVAVRGLLIVLAFLVEHGLQ